MSELLRTKRKNEHEIAFIKEFWVPNSENRQKIEILIEENRHIKRLYKEVS